MARSSISDFPPHIQKQILEKLKHEDNKATTFCMSQNVVNHTTKTKKAPKYRNKKTIVNDISFDSKKEARRYQELILMLKSGEISDLRLQVDFTLQEAYTTPSGQRIRAIRYRADFVYKQNNKLIIEDVKSRITKTTSYNMKKKLLHEKYGLHITEI